MQKVETAKIERAREHFTAVLGADAVLTSRDQVMDFHDPYEGAHPYGYQPSFVVQPTSVEQVQSIVKIAREHGVPLWTSSTGRNFGYDGSAPIVEGSVVLNFRRMNRVLEINEKFGFALCEPGVRFFDLYDAIRAQGAKLMICTPDLGWGSVVGNRPVFPEWPAGNSLGLRSGRLMAGRECRAVRRNI